MRPLLFIILSLTFVACVRQNSPAKNAINEFKYSAFLWHLSPHNDSFNFYLGHYIDIDKNGRFKVMRRDSFMAKPKFFEGTLSDTLLTFIRTTFAIDTFGTDYNWNVNDGFIYDGFIYCIDIKKPVSVKTKKIFFIPNKAPSELKYLSTKLETLIYDMKGATVDTIDTYLYQEQLKQDYVNKYGQMPKIHKEQSKFKPVKIRK